MAYVLTEEQQLLKDSARDLLKSSPVSMVRKLRDEEDEQSFSTGTWSQMIEMGWPGLALKEENGGLDFGLRSLGILMEESGKSLTASPLHSIAVATKIIEKHGSQAQKARLADVCMNGDVIALAIQEGEYFQPENPQLNVTVNGSDFSLSGKKDMVLDGHVAKYFLVSGQSDLGTSIFLVDAKADGVSITKEFMMDSRYYAKVHFDGTIVSSGHIVGVEGKGQKVSNDIINIGNALLSAELVGLMTEAFERTLEYLKERRQFDKAIGTFQGLQHRAAHLYSEIELARSITIKALDALDAEDFMAPAFCSMAKAKTSKVAQLATNEGIQMFGGIGMTDDEEIGFFLKRARVAAQYLGNYSYHTDRFARMNGY